MQTAPPTPKGFRDIAPDNAAIRRKTINTIVEILEKHEFVPLETPTVEFAQTLTGKYGDEEKLIYKFNDRGNRELALRYDLTVPLARFIANNQNMLNPFFSRYQVGQVFRGENPQHGRYREFTQFDFDTVGSSNLEDDAKVIACALESIKALGLLNAQLLINDRKNFESLPIEVPRAIDKIHKIGIDGVKAELSKSFKEDEITEFLDKVKTAKPTEDLKIIFSALVQKYNLVENKDFIFDPTLARGLDYYTGAIFEMKPSTDSSTQTIGSGGRYDNLIGMFAGKNIPAVGFSFGVDRLIEQLS